MAEQNLPLNEDTVSPLFNKMDALMARHRSPAGKTQAEIPVLTDLAPKLADIPVLTDVISQEELLQKIEHIERSLSDEPAAAVVREPIQNQGIPVLMFSTLSSPDSELDLTPPPPVLSNIQFETPISEPIPAPAEPIFFNLPRLDLAAIEDDIPLIPASKPAAAPVAAPFECVADDLIIDFSNPIDTQHQVNAEPAAADLVIPPAQATSEPAPAIETSTSRQPTRLVATSTLVWEDDVESAPQSLSTPNESPSANALSEAAIADLTAIVGAQLAVDIASEVEQLARQHFSKLMAQFYGDTLRELTSEISQELETRLAPRISELVKQELISQGLIKNAE
ncbi:hypothetical protein HQN60_08120 [Deefgea piscis]|uniref:DUF2497 domain-containing protein n=1 Tax=Deefgea piscis TaxID=2739061 RepID=A0A6M8SN56_9NEIS|nr:hypothetical protein [Deefgea piscis]QKJ66672.1 hypothetical protein HQN60_08120 [Deefgea piscis]